MRTPIIGFAVAAAAVLAAPEARAGECGASSPECHLANGRKLLDSDPKAAASELLASYKLDERTETLTLYATALAADHQYARALETWQRIILFREAEIETAREAMGVPSVKKRNAARAQLARAQEASEQAAAEIMKLWSKVGRVTVVHAPGERVTVSSGGTELDATKDILVNAGRDELMFTRPDGSTTKVVVELAAGQAKIVEVPAEDDRGLLTPAPRPAPVVTAPSAPAPVIVTAPRPMASLRVVETERSPRIARTGLALAAGGVIALGAAGTFAYLAHRDFDRAEGLGCAGNGDCPLGPASDLGERAHDRTRFAQVAAIGGGALVATGVTMWIIGRGKTRRAATDVTLSVGPSGVGIGWSLR